MTFHCKHTDGDNLVKTNREGWKMNEPVGQDKYEGRRWKAGRWTSSWRDISWRVHRGNGLDQTLRLYIVCIIVDQRRNRLHLPSGPQRSLRRCIMKTEYAILIRRVSWLSQVQQGHTLYQQEYRKACHWDQGWVTWWDECFPWEGVSPGKLLRNSIIIIITGHWKERWEIDGEFLEDRWKIELNHGTWLTIQNGT